MKYEIHARALARSDESIGSVHTRLFQHLHTHSKLCRDGVIPATPKIKGGNLITSCSLKGFLPRGMTGHIVYQFRRDFKTSPLSGDDWMVIEFKPHLDFSSDIIDDFLPALIQSMDPYKVTVGDQRFDEPVWDAHGRTQVGGPRACGCKLHPVFFLADWRLQQMYGLTLEQATAALLPVVAKVSVVGNGLFVVGARDALEFEAAKERVLQIEKRLHLAKPGLLSFLKGLLKLPNNLLQ